MQQGSYNARDTEMLPELKLDDLVRLRKTHPCGSTDWKVVRLGADIGLVCQGCGHRVLMERRKLVKSMKKLNPPDGMTVKKSN
jgi:hypothetical protein